MQFQKLKPFKFSSQGFHKSKGYFDCAFLMQVTDNNLYLKASFTVYLEIKVIEGKERVESKRTAEFEGKYRLSSTEMGI